MTFCRLSLALSLSILATDIALAAGPSQSAELAPSLTTTLAVGYLTGESHEYVYDNGAKLSQLNWKIDNATLLKGGIDYRVLPWLNLGVAGWSTVDSGNSTMDDYDWTDPSRSEWSDWSHHSDTRLVRAYQTEASVTAWVLQEQRYGLGLIAGYQRNVFKWRAQGGQYIYSDVDFRDTVGSFEPGQTVITYQQEFDAPYLGVVGNLQLGDWAFSAQLKGSRWVKARDKDNHHLRNLVFKDTGEGSRLYSASLEAAYGFHENAALVAAVEFQQYTKGKGKMVAYDGDSGSVTTEQDAAGLDNRSFQASLGLQYRFQ